jgi:DNA adenine methylase
VKHILPLIPEDCGELCSPFLGGGSVELAVAERGTRVHAYDLFEPVVWFWQALLSDPARLAALADEHRVGHVDYGEKRGLLKEDFHRLRTELRKNYTFSFENAAKFYAINRSSFSGATFSGGWSKRASYARFTDSSIDRIKNFNEPSLSVECADFKDSITKHPDAFLYLDPPYLLGEDKDRLYGDNGSTHAGFDHKALYEILSKRTGWVLSYNSCEEIRELYKDYQIIDAKWAYGMKNVTPPAVIAEKKFLEQLIGILEEVPVGVIENQELYINFIDSLRNRSKELKKAMGSSSEILITG